MKTIFAQKIVSSGIYISIFYDILVRPRVQVQHFEITTFRSCDYDQMLYLNLSWKKIVHFKPIFVYVSQYKTFQSLPTKQISLLPKIFSVISWQGKDKDLCFSVRKPIYFRIKDTVKTKQNFLK